MAKITFSHLVSSASALTLTVALCTGESREAQACAAEPLIGSVCFTAISYCPYGFVEANGQLLSVQNYQPLFALLGTTYGGNGSTTFGVPDLRGRSPVGYNPSAVMTGNNPQTIINPVQRGEMRGVESSQLVSNNLPPHNHPATFTGTGGGGTGPLQASGTVSLPVTVNVPAQNISVSGGVKIANKTATGTQNVTDNAVLTKAGGGQGAIYATSSTTADTNIGPTQTFSGSTSNATVNTNASGAVALPVTGATGITGGTVAVGANSTGNAAFSNLPPQTGLKACIAWSGIWPSQP